MGHPGAHNYEKSHPQNQIRQDSMHKSFSEAAYGPITPTGDDILRWEENLHI